VVHFGTRTLAQRFVPVTRRQIALDRPVTDEPQIGIAFEVDAVARALHSSDVERQMGAGTQTFWNGRQSDFQIEDVSTSFMNDLQVNRNEHFRQRATRMALSTFGSLGVHWISILITRNRI